jgi:hypothetical protein
MTMEVYTATEQAYENGRARGKQEAAAVIDGLLLKVESLKLELEEERYRHDLYRDFELGQAQVLEKTKQALAEERKITAQLRAEVARLRALMPRFYEREVIVTLVQSSMGGCSRDYAEGIADYLMKNGMCLQMGAWVK